MADNILKKNKIPGREQLTRPSEIGALSKYLGEIREIQEEHTKLDKRTLEVRGRGNKAYFPEIESLDDRREDFITQGLPGLSSLDDSTHEMPKNTIPQVSSLDDSVVKGESPKEVSLDDSITGMSDNTLPDAKSLDDSVSKFVDNYGKTPKALDDSIVKAGGNTETISGLDSSVTAGIKSQGKDTKVLDSSVSRLNTKEKVEGLDSSKTILGTSDKIKSLDESIEGLNLPGGLLGLDESVTGILGNLGGNVRGLDNSMTGLSSDHNSGLEKLDNSITGLVQGEGGVVKELSEYTEELNVDSKVKNLGGYVEPGVESIGGSPKGLDDTTTRTPWNYGNSPKDLDDSLTDLHVNPLVKILGNQREDLDVDSKIKELPEGKIQLGADGKIEGLDEYLEELGAEPCVADLDDSLTKIKINNLVHALRNDKSELEVEALIEDLSRFVLLGIPYDQKITEIKELLDNAEDLNLDQAFSKVIGLFSRYSKEESSFAWLEKITGILSEAIYCRQPDKDSKHRNTLPTGGVTDIDRSRFEIFSQKLKEVSETSKATALRSIADWEAKTVGKTGNQKNRLTDWDNTELMRSGYINTRTGDINSLKDTIRKKRSIQSEVGNSRKYESVPDYQLPDNRNFIKSVSKAYEKGGVWNATKAAVSAASTTGIMNGIGGLNSMDYARLSIEKLAKKTGKFKYGSGALKSELLRQSLRAAAESIYMAKWAAGMDPNRLPGTAYQPGVTGNASRVLRMGMETLKIAANAMVSTSSLITGGVSKAVDLFQKKNSSKNMGRGTNRPNPVNRPNTGKGNWKSNQGRDVKPTEVYENAGGRQSKKSFLDKDSIADVFYRLFINLDDPDYTETKFKSAVDDLGYEIDFKKNYLSSEGIQTTLKDLCNVSGDGLPSSFDALKDILRNSPYITTPDKFTNTNNFTNNAQTLPVTNYWEIIIEPFVNDKMNGGFSYLPAIQEINLINEKKHGVFTGYNHWLPFTGFDLSLLKMETKSAGLFEGEIVYPTGAEEVNELRITMADDIYRSWAWYWKTVMEVSVFNSVPHDKYYYEGKSVYYPITPTYVDHTVHSVALYKNLTFSIKIYIMTPQYSTIKSFDLLCVLKDWSDSYTGDVDTGGGGDINLSFSVVGENPDAHAHHENPFAETDKNGDKKIKVANLSSEMGVSIISVGESNGELERGEDLEEDDLETAQANALDSKSSSASNASKVKSEYSIASMADISYAVESGRVKDGVFLDESGNSLGYISSTDYANNVNVIKSPSGELIGSAEFTGEVDGQAVVTLKDANGNIAGYQRHITTVDENGKETIEVRQTDESGNYYTSAQVEKEGTRIVETGDWIQDTESGLMYPETKEEKYTYTTTEYTMHNSSGEVVEQKALTEADVNLAEIEKPESWYDKLSEEDKKKANESFYEAIHGKTEAQQQPQQQ